MAEYYEITMKLLFKVQGPEANDDEIDSLEEAIEAALDTIGSFPNPSIGPFELLSCDLTKTVKVDGD